jgi:hypothetical protein
VSLNEELPIRLIRGSPEKITDVVGLHLEPAAGAVVHSLDEKAQVQALDRGPGVVTLLSATVGQQRPAALPMDRLALTMFTEGSPITTGGADAAPDLAERCRRR